LLWRGDVDGAIAILNNIDSKKIRNNEKIKQLIDYLNRMRFYIPCYALRKALGLRNSSNRGEKANDIIVAKRQKHNGMSWSREGSSSLAFITCLRKNGELNEWLHNKTISFKLVPIKKKAA
ncbi:MAG: hypothetical protein LBT62_00840, partial [Deltaproteobacteria bacterium]|nr:hypothetical protein [Deltaproteobacteria bacterium]